MIETILTIALFAALVFFAPVLAVAREHRRDVDLTGVQRIKTFVSPDADHRLKLASDDEQGPGSFIGYGSVFGNIDSDEERMAQGAYSETLAQYIERGFVGIGHDWKSGVATISDAKEDNYGLLIDAMFHSDSESQMHRTRMMERRNRGKFVGLSVGFRIRGYEWEEGSDILTITKAELYEVSIVTVPANSAAGVLSAKSAEWLSKPGTIREFERFLRDVGNFSNKEAEIIASRGFKGFGSDLTEEPGGNQGEPDDVVAQIEAMQVAFYKSLTRADDALLPIF